MTTNRKPEWFFYPAWIILTALSVPVAFVLYLVSIRIIVSFVGDFIYVDGVRHITEDYLLQYLFLPLMSLVMGLLQYGLLRRYLPRMGWWVPATIVGGLLGFVLSFGWFQAAMYFWTEAVIRESWVISPAFVAVGLSVGAGQWLLLRRRLPRASWWIVANAAGWGLLLLITNRPLNQFDLLSIGLLPAGITAVTFALLLNQTASPKQPMNLAAPS